MLHLFDLEIREYSSSYSSLREKDGKIKSGAFNFHELMTPVDSCLRQRMREKEREREATLTRTSFSLFLIHVLREKTRTDVSRVESVIASLSSLGIKIIIPWIEISSTERDIESHSVLLNLDII